ncbi:MAG: hypothetical protein J5940_01335, partial [Clostridia bacterium]|nr:hypothetical protein [Clostridia bacterium]
AGRAGSLSAAAFAVGFSGISVMFQTADISLRAGISMRYWIIGKLYSSIVCLAAINMLAFFDLL